MTGACGHAVNMHYVSAREDLAVTDIYKPPLHRHQSSCAAPGRRVPPPAWAHSHYFATVSTLAERKRQRPTQRFDNPVCLNAQIYRKLYLSHAPKGKRNIYKFIQSHLRLGFQVVEGAVVWGGTRTTTLRRWIGFWKRAGDKISGLRHWSGNKHTHAQMDGCDDYTHTHTRASFGLVRLVPYLV